jgi:hypothetical protein
MLSDSADSAVGVQQQRVPPVSDAERRYKICATELKDGSARRICKMEQQCAVLQSGCEREHEKKE